MRPILAVGLPLLQRTMVRCRDHFGAANVAAMNAANASISATLSDQGAGLGGTTSFSALDGWIDVFRTGDHTDMGGRTTRWTAADLAGIVADYGQADPAPVVLGHPETDGPALGWVRGLRVMGDRLQARLDRLDPSFRGAVEAGRYAPRSVALAPTATGWRLRHLGFLGAQNPAVAGLAPTQFSARADGALLYSCPTVETLMNQPVFAAATAAQPQFVAQPLQPQFATQPQPVQPQPAAQPVQQPVQPQPVAQPAQPQPQAQPQFVAQPVQPVQQPLQPQPQPVQPAVQFTPTAALPPSVHGVANGGFPAGLALVQPAAPQFAADPPAGALPPGAAQVTQHAVAQPQASVATDPAAVPGEAAQLAAERQAIFAERQLIAAERMARGAMDRERTAASRVDAHVQAGRVLPAEGPAYAALYCALEESGGQITMAGADGRPMALAPSGVLDGLLAALPQRVPIGMGQPLAAASPAGSGAAALVAGYAQPQAGQWPGDGTASQEAQFAAATQDLASRARALMAADKTGTLDLPTAIRRAAAGEQAQ